MEIDCLISIIIPIYNVESYLNRCLDSILYQSCKRFELILVNDGSTDNSADICKNYACADSRINLINKKNSGASSARNEGIKAASGKYILFIDGDDYIENSSLEKIINWLNENSGSDIVFLKSVSVLPNGRFEKNDVYSRDDYYKKSHIDILSYFATHDPLPVCVWNKLIKREVIAANSIYFTEGIICEDVDFCIRLYMHAKTYDYFDAMYYYYRKDRIGSVMNVNTEKKYYSLLDIIKHWALLAETEYKNYALYIYKILAFQYCMMLPMYKKLPKEKQICEKQNVASLAWLLKYPGDKRVYILNFIYKLLGFDCTANMLMLYDKSKTVLYRKG